MALGPYLLGRIQSLEDEAKLCDDDASRLESRAAEQRMRAEAARFTIEYLRKSDALAHT